jgi:hypothetical protein
MRYSSVKVLLTVSPFRRPFPPPLNVFSRIVPVLPFTTHRPAPIRSGSRITSHVVSYSCKLFVAAKNLNSFIIRQIHTLYAKHPGWGVPRKGRPAESTTYKLSSCGVFANQLPFAEFVASEPFTSHRSQVTLFQGLAGSLSSLCALFRMRSLCFQWFAASFPGGCP